jgi:ornithine cyclodeaminase
MIATIEAPQVERLLTFPGLVDALELAFRNAVAIPERAIHDVPGGGTLLIMPAWDGRGHLGVKIATVFPGNGAYGLPATASTYVLLDGMTGLPKLLVDGAMLTHRRTAAASALASRFLSVPESSTLLMVGSGALSAHLVEAHCAVRPIEHVFVWGRSIEKARAAAARLKRLPAAVEPVSDLRTAVEAADIISCATLSKEPLVLGQWLRPGQHLDLVGGFKPDMREVDSDAVARSRIFADTRAGVMLEAGDILVPMAEGRIARDAIAADLFALSAGGRGRTSREEITLFKSVGAALEDLAAAVHLLSALPSAAAA